MRKILAWVDDNLLFLLSGFLLAFIPLYPKLPLFEAIPGYIVRVRLEDLLIVGTLIIWLIQIIRGKNKFGPNPLAKPIAAYLLVGILSMLSAVFLIKTVPFELLHIGKMALHFFRRVEYFSLFFVFYSSVKSLKQVKWYLIILALTMIGVTLYGYGQKYLYWPAFSTMNREFAKGWQLYLSEHARVLSTFGGHYDLAAYTMGVLIILWSLFFSVKQKLLKAGIFVSILGAFWLLILTVSRTSFLAYLAGVSVLFFFWMFRKGIRWSAPRWFAVIAGSVLIMLLFGDLSDRFLKLLKLDQRVSNIKSLIQQPFGKPPSEQNFALLENNIEAVTSKSDFPPLPTKPSDVFEDIPDGIITTQSATGASQLTEVPRTYSQAAIVYDLSTGIRLDALWPQAIKGFMRNPLLGSGYSTLNKAQINDFTEAESTDNDYLRALGETGLLGFLTFAWILAVVIISIWKVFTRVRDNYVFAYLVGFAALVFGLLVNAVYIDIFEASKVALTFWAMVGIALGALKFLPPQEKGFLYVPQIPDLSATIKLFRQTAINIVKSPKTYLLLIIVLSVSLRHYKITEPLADWHSWRQADTSAVTRNFLRYGMDPLYPRYDDLSSVASGKPNPQGYRFVEFPLYNMASVVTDKLFPGYSIEYSGRLTSILMSVGTLILLYLLVARYLNPLAGLLTALVFAVLPYNIFWSRVILPEPTLVFLTIGMLYFFDSWILKNKKRYYLLSLLFAIGALLVKFTAVFFAIPMVYLAFTKWRFKTLVNPWLWIYAVLMLLPFGLWRMHISQYPEGIPAYTWLFNGNGIRFKGAFFWWLFSERIAHLILGSWGLIPFGIGVLFTKFREKSNWLFHFWLLAMISYLVVFATGNVQHDYYQIILVPILSVFVGVGSYYLLFGGKHHFNVWISRVLIIVSLIFMCMFGWYQARDLFNINHPEIVEAGRAMDRLLGDKRGNTIAPYGGDTAFLYQTGQKGWPLMEGTIDEMIEKQAHYYISTNFDDTTNEIIQIATNANDPLHPFKILEQTDRYVIVQLVRDNELPSN
ncbi:hypothetical protein C4564_00855 [Candidatus Microgenomates bacterium]|nr:MAG: hypothetical protein C4564_00855 [Candidatus Microgenomates bacterium]